MPRPATPRRAAPAKPAARAARPADAPRKGRVGRPSRLSREMIIEVSLKLLSKHPVEDFTLAQVAKKLDTVSMALYNYFPSREALIAEVANHIGKQFTMPPPQPGQDWKQTLRDWLWTLRALGEKYPVLFRIAGIDGKTSAGWLRIIRVPGTLLQELGFRGKDLALTYWQLCLKAHALVHAEITAGGFHAPVSLSRLEELEAAEQAFFLALRPFQGQVTGADIMEEGFADLVGAIERKLEARAKKRR
jgi:AcrR family transcriptional regulator